MEDERKAFEDWYCPPDGKYGPQVYNLGRHGEYKVDATYHAWEAWQAGAEQKNVEKTTLLTEKQQLLDALKASENQVARLRKALQYIAIYDCEWDYESGKIMYELAEEALHQTERK